MKNHKSQRVLLGPLGLQLKVRKIACSRQGFIGLEGNLRRQIFQLIRQIKIPIAFWLSALSAVGHKG